MSHSKPYINSLPTKLLTQVFDHLDFKDGVVVSIVCTRWHEILSDDRYKVCHRLRLEPKPLDEENFNNLKRYRSIAIRSDYFNETIHQEKLLQYLFNGESVEMLEELEIVLSVTIWNNIFGTEGELNLPNLRSLHISVPMDSSAEQMPCRIVAPKLKTFRTDSDTISAPLELFNDQIETLVVDFPKQGQFLKTSLGLSFQNLRSLTLNSTDKSYMWLKRYNFHSGYEAVFSRLDHLKILDVERSFSDVYELIIEAATNLKSLEIDGVKGWGMSDDAFVQLNQLKQLNELVLMLTIKRNAGKRGLLLPKLTKLTTYADTLVPLDSVPSLRTLTIANSKQYFGGYNFYRPNFLKAQFRGITDQLESLKIIRVFLDDNAINRICTLTNLKSLKLIEVEADSPGIVKIFKSLKNLKHARFTNCRFADQVIYCDDDSDCGCECCAEGYNVPDDGEPDEPCAGQQFADFFAKLAVENVGCSIVAEGGRVGSCFMSNLCNFRRNDGFDEEEDEAVGFFVD